MGWICTKCGSENPYKSSICEACLQRASPVYRWGEKMCEFAELDALRMYRQNAPTAGIYLERFFKVGRLTTAALSLGTIVCLILLAAVVIWQAGTPENVKKQTVMRTNSVSNRIALRLDHNTDSIFPTLPDEIIAHLNVGIDEILVKSDLVQQNVRDTAFNGADCINGNIDAAVSVLADIGASLSDKIDTSKNRFAYVLRRLRHNLLSIWQKSGNGAGLLDLGQYADIFRARIKNAVSVIRERAELLRKRR